MSESVYIPIVPFLEARFRPGVAGIPGATPEKPFPLPPYWRRILPLMFTPQRVEKNGRMIWKLPHRNVLISLPKKSMKALSILTPIPTPDGWVLMGEIRAGDIIYNDRGQPVSVTYVTPIVEGRQCFEVEFSNGTSLVTDGGHEWWVGSRLKPGRGISASDDGFYWHKATTEEMAPRVDCEWDYLKKHNINLKNYSIPLAPAIQCDAVALPIHPYVLGAWLGDGTSTTLALTVGAGDEEILERVREAGYPIKRLKSRERTPQYSFSDGKKGARMDGLARPFVELGLLGKGNKHIPQMYLRASVEQRMELLRGLMDTDGTVAANGYCVFYNSNPKVAFGVHELLTSLGIKSGLSRRDARLNGRVVGDAYTVHFKCYSDASCFSLKRKAERLKAPPINRARSRNLRIVSIREVESVPVRCIAVDTPSHLYLAGTGMVPTHNTTVAAAIGVWFATCIAEENDRIYVVANKREQAKERAWSYIYNAYRNDPVVRGTAEDVFDNWVLTKNGTKLQPITADAGGEAGANAGLVLWDEIWEMCLGVSGGDRVEVLTQLGWKLATDVTLDDYLVTRREDGAVEYHQPTAINRQRYAGPMHRFRHRRCEFLVTPNHRVLGGFANGGRDRNVKLRKGVEYEFRSAAAASRAWGGWIPQRVEWDGVAYSTVRVGGLDIDGDAFFELLGWWLAEGYTRIRAGRPRGFAISQDRAVNPEKYAKIIDCLTRCGLEGWCGPRGIEVSHRGIGEFFQSLGKQHARYIPRWVLEGSSRQLRLLLEAYLLGDGWVTPGLGWQCATTSMRLRDDIMEVGLKAGWVPRDMGIKARAGKRCRGIGGGEIIARHDLHRVSFSVAPLAWERRHGHWSTELYEGEIWCPTIPNGTFYVRFNGTCFWTGNSGPRADRLWTELTPVLTRDNSIRVVSSYAGIEGQASILYNLWKVHQASEPHPDCLDLVDDEGQPVLRVNEEAQMISLWDTEQRMPWQLDEEGRKYFLAQEATMSRGEFNRVYRNKWSTGQGSLNIEDWDACTVKGNPETGDPGYEPPSHGRNLYLAVGVDASWAFGGDLTAVVTWYKFGGKFCLGPWRMWAPDKDFDLEGKVGGFLEELRQRWFLYKGLYDPLQLHSIMHKFRRQVPQMAEWKQTQANKMHMAGILVNALRDRQLVLPDFETGAWPMENVPHPYQQAKNVTLKEVAAGGWSIERVSRRQKIDWIIAAAMGLVAAQDLPDVEMSMGGMGQSISVYRGR